MGVAKKVLRSGHVPIIMKNRLNALFHQQKVDYALPNDRSGALS
jgi:hypothetical protein